MNRRAYFLACLNVHFTAWLVEKAESTKDFGVSLRMWNLAVAAYQFEAWSMPEEAIPANPAEAALAFFDYVCNRGADVKPAWYAEWKETKESKSE